MDYSRNSRVRLTISRWRKSQNQFESCWEDNISGEKPSASFLHSTKSRSRIPLLDTLTYLNYFELVWKSMHTHVANTWLTSFMPVIYVLNNLIETHLAQAIIQNIKKTDGVLVPPDDQNKALNVQICRKNVRVNTLTKTAKLREDRSLMIRPDINIEDVISVHEFSCIPRSLFVSAGSMLPYMDKNKLFHIMTALYKEQDPNAQDQEDDSVLIVDACPRANRNESFKTCLELSAV